MIVLGDVLGGFRDAEWSEGVCPASAKPDVKFFVRERRAIPITRGVIEATVKSSDLVDAAGGEMVIIDHRPVKELLDRTWAALVVIANADGSAITYISSSTWFCHGQDCIGRQD